MSAIAELRSKLAADLEKVDAAIRGALDSSNELMNQVIYAYMSHRGKQMRPMMVLLTARLFHGDILKAVNSSAAVELLHNASLIHDDIVDESASRHGHPTINATHGPHVAVIVGDYFTSNALNMALLDGDIRVPMALGRLGELLTLGEMDQMETSLKQSLDPADYMNVISHKTASLFVACAEMGCYASRATEDDIRAMREFAECFGRAFQIRDDIFDYFDDPAIGKPTGQDLQEGKITLPLLHALSLPTGEREAMTALALKPGKNADELKRVIDYAVAKGGVEYSCRVMRDLRDRAARAVKSLGDTRDLMTLFDFVIDRDC